MFGQSRHEGIPARVPFDVRVENKRAFLYPSSTIIEWCVGQFGGISEDLPMSLWWYYDLMEKRILECEPERPALRVVTCRGVFIVTRRRESGVHRDAAPWRSWWPGDPPGAANTAAGVTRRPAVTLAVTSPMASLVASLVASSVTPLVAQTVTPPWHRRDTAVPPSVTPPWYRPWHRPHQPLATRSSRSNGRRFMTNESGAETVWYRENEQLWVTDGNFRIPHKSIQTLLSISCWNESLEASLSGKVGQCWLKEVVVNICTFIGVGTMGAMGAAPPTIFIQCSGCRQCILHPQYSGSKTLFSIHHA